MLKNNGVSEPFSVPKHAYTGSHALVFHNLVCGDTVISQHDVQDHTLKAGTFIDKAAVEQTLYQIVGKDDNAGWCDQRILFENTTHLVWYRKASNTPTTLWFRTASHAVDVAVKLPTLIFVRDKQTHKMHLFAAAGVQRPTPKTRLYRAPICNTSAGGSFCWGSANPPLYKARDAFIAETESCLFDSAFTHVSQPHTFNKQYGKTIETTKHIRIWCQLAEKQQRPMACDMVSTGKNLEATLKEIMK